MCRTVVSTFCKSCHKRAQVVRKGRIPAEIVPQDKIDKMTHHLGECSELEVHDVSCLCALSQSVSVIAALAEIILSHDVQATVAWA